MNRLKQTASDWIAFIKAPTLDLPMQERSALRDVGWLFALNCLIVAAIAAVLFPAMLLFDVEMSNDMSELFKRPIWQILAIVVIVGPITEELVFRSWISGNPKLLLLLGGILIWFGGSYSLAQVGFTGANPIPLIILTAIIAVAVLVGQIRYWKRPSPVWYARIFPVIFWAQALLFGFIHVFNYAGDNPTALLPLVLPQLVGGLIWGYARIKYGWWSNIVMHMAYNLLATSGLLYMLFTGGEMVSS